MNRSKRNGYSSGDEADIILVQPRSKDCEGEETPAGDGSKFITKTNSQSYEDIIEDDGEDDDDEGEGDEELTEEPVKKKKRNLYLMRLIRRKRVAFKKKWGAGKPCVLVEKNYKLFGMLEKLQAPKKIQSWLNSMDGSYCEWEELQDHIDPDDQNVSSPKKNENCPTPSPPPVPLNVYLSKDEISNICQKSISKLSQDELASITSYGFDKKNNDVDTNSSSTIGKHPLSSSSSSYVTSTSETPMLTPAPTPEPKPSQLRLQPPPPTEGLVEVEIKNSSTRFGGIISKIFRRQSKVSPSETPLLVDEGLKNQEDTIGENDQNNNNDPLDVDDAKAQKDAIELEQEYTEEIQRLSLLLKSSTNYKKKTTDRTIFSMQNKKVIRKRRKKNACARFFSRFVSTYFGCCHKISSPIPVSNDFNNGRIRRPPFQCQSQRPINFQHRRRNRPAQIIHPLSASSPAGENFRVITPDEARQQEIALAELQMQREVYIRNVNFRNRMQSAIGRQQVHNF